MQFRTGTRSRLLEFALAALVVFPASAQTTNPPPVDLTGPISLKQAVQVGLLQHANVLIAKEGLEASRQRVRQARVGTLPSVLFELGYGGTAINDLLQIFGTQDIPNSLGFDQGIQPTVMLRHTLFDGGLTRSSVRRARAGVNSAREGVRVARNDLSFLIASSYLAQLRAASVLDLRRTQEQLALDQLRLVEGLIEGGAAPESDKALPLSAYRNTQVDRIQAENDLRIAATRLRNIMGLPAGPLLLLIDVIERTLTLEPMSALMNQALRSRPEILQDEAQVRVSREGVQLARLRRRPLVSTSFGFNVNPNLKTKRSDFVVAATISMPLWDAGLTHAQEREARTDYRSAQRRLEQTRKDVMAEVEEAYRNAINARERLDASKLAVQAAGVNLNSTNARYELNLVTTVELTTAQVQYFQANNNAIQALYDVHLARVQLNRALGRTS